jgi:heme/copper-type cytochrome/quinol oxidase subunit 4
MAQKMKSKSYTLLFGLMVFVLTAVGLAFLYYEVLVPPFLFIFAYLVAWVLVFGFAFDLFITGSKWSKKKVLLFTFGVMIISTTVTHSVWTIVTPRWSFSVITDKNTYRLGEEVKIIVSLKNLGFITHSFKSRVIEPVLVMIEYEYTAYTLPVWCNSVHEIITEFSIKPNQSLERNFVWNQTKSANIEFGEEIEPGGYYIKAFVPSADSTMPITVDNLFWAWTKINITST